MMLDRKSPPAGVARGSGHAAAAPPSLQRLLRDTRGVAALEFAILSPALLAILFGIFAFGVAFKDYLVITNAANQGALVFALSRGGATPYAGARAAVLAAAPTLTAANIVITIAIDNVACATDSACTNAMAAGKAALVTATYPCTLVVMGRNFAPNGCRLTGRTAHMIQ